MFRDNVLVNYFMVGCLSVRASVQVGMFSRYLDKGANYLILFYVVVGYDLALLLNLLTAPYHLETSSPFTMVADFIPETPTSSPSTARVYTARHSGSEDVGQPLI